MAKQEFQTVKDAIAAEGHSWHASPSFLSNLPEEEGKKYLGYTPGGDELSLEAREKSSVEKYAAYLSTSPDTGAFAAPAAPVLDRKSVV